MATAVKEKITGYCMHEHAQRVIVNPKRVTMKNGLKALKGTCKKCGGTIYRIMHQA